MPPATTAANHQAVQPVSRKEASHGYFLLLALPPDPPPFCPADAFAGLTGTSKTLVCPKGRAERSSSAIAHVFMTDHLD
ncbi:hypothetical protein AGR3A_Cc360048 [Agrobacterium tomkonis CFBP 6623]|uniref:Uncharacterized protein n=1 Tax=Agrobacterium tomkonis CFBP 6623 TaxID=1183432 RepID=A0A1S7PZ44_9HYPH|nr:hypothetical protein AGR3A_Cc360048 [Agrobacterium tomkonis CFBP 6623]